jgi:hypothetical protein
MKPSHAAALTLVGWYLLAAPAGNSSAPLSTWIQEGAFDTAAECETTKLQAIETKCAASVPQKDCKALHDTMANSDCFATDDPRLAK